jgi:transcriptional regulator with XRE-family HTH domain
MSAESILGQNIRRYRKQHAMTQKDLAKITGVASMHISNIEQGRTGVSLDRLVLICEQLNVSLADVLPINKRDNSDLREKWLEEILSVIVELDTAQLGIVRTMICSLLPE